MSSYTLDIWGDIFQVLEAEDQQTPMLSLEGIKRAKGKGVNTDKQVVTLIEVAPK